MGVVGSVVWSEVSGAEDQAMEVPVVETDLDPAEAVDPDPVCLER